MDGFSCVNKKTLAGNDIHGLVIKTVRNFELFIDKSI